jgi:hypothetical protein
VSEEKDQRAGEPTDDVESHMKAARSDEMKSGMKAANDEGDDVEGDDKEAHI